MKQKKLNVAGHPKYRGFWGLKPGTVFLNHGSFGACPRPILKLQRELRAAMEAEPVQFLWRRYEERLEPARAKVARFVGARARDLVFVTNATVGVNSVFGSLQLKPGDELLTTNHNYNACHNVLVEAARRAQAQVVVAKVPFPIKSPDEVIEAVLNKVTPRTRLAFLDHVTSPTALVFPIAHLIRALEARGIDTLVDGAHGPGMLTVNLQKLRPAYYTANLHKWVCAPKGAGFLWAREDKQAGLIPAVISHGYNTPRLRYSKFQDQFDWAGTFDPTPWLCAAAAIDWLENIFPGGWPAIRKANHQLALEGRKRFCQALQVEPPCPDSMIGSTATLPLPARFQDRPKRARIDLEQGYIYDRFGVEVPFVRFGAPARRFLRLSAHIYNCAAQYDCLAEAINACP